MGASGKRASQRRSRNGPAAAPPPPPPDDTRALLEAVFEASAAGLAILSGDALRFAKVNPAYRALTPHPEIDPVGRTFAEVWGLPEATLAQRVAVCLETGEPLHEDDLAVTIEGIPRRFSYHVKRVSYGGRAALLLAMWETTAFFEQRRAAEAAAETALRHAAELDAVIDAIADGLVLFGPRGEIVRLNATAARFAERAGLDLSRGLEGLHDQFRISTPEGRPMAWAEGAVAKALAGDTVLSSHLHVEVPHAGLTLSVALAAAPIRAAGGAVAGAVLTFSDETSLRELEEARDDLVRMISHDLRTPLNAVYNHAHLLRRAPGDAEKVAERAAAIVRSCERMRSMIQDLVETTLLEAGQLRLDRTRLDLAAVIPELLERLRGGLEVDRVKLTVEPGLPPVHADPARLERIVVNLLSNALKYSSPQSPVALDLGPGPRGEAMLTVRDRGVGIAPEDQPHVFERFFRARGARRPEGLGLGLYITRLLVEAHGGRIEVASGLGQGSTFRVLLPSGPLREPSTRPRVPAR